jgi:hypothetical protein
MLSVTFCIVMLSVVMPSVVCLSVVALIMMAVVLASHPLQPTFHEAGRSLIFFENY